MAKKATNDDPGTGEEFTARELVVERWPLERLRPDPENARRHPERNLEAIAASFRRFGQQKPIVVLASGVVVAGNGALAAAQRLGWTHLDVIVTPLEEAEATAYAIADNRTAELAGWNPDILLSTLRGLDGDLATAAGYTAEELDLLFDAHAVGDVLIPTEGEGDGVGFAEGDQFNAAPGFEAVITLREGLENDPGFKERLEGFCAAEALDYKIRRH